MVWLGKTNERRQRRSERERERIACSSLKAVEEIRRDSSVADARDVPI